MCSVGVYGTQYVRDGEAVPSSIEIDKGKSTTLSIKHIYSKLTITNSLSINLRQSGSTLPFVTFTEQSDSTDVVINTTGVDPGEYSLTLESFNTLSLAQSALKTDSMTITVVGTPSFVQNPENKSIEAGSGALWVLPAIDEGSESLKEIKVQPDDALYPYITFDSDSRAIIFKEDEGSKSLGGQFLPIKITLVNVKGKTSEYTMYVILFDPNAPE